MSDNVHYPDWPAGAGQSGGGGGGTHIPDTEGRIANLETDVKDLKAVLGRMEPVLARMDARSERFATKEDVAMATGALNTLSERIRASEERSGRLEKSVDGAVTAAIGKAISPWQFSLILAGSAAVLIAAAGAANWLMSHGFFPHSP